MKASIREKLNCLIAQFPCVMIEQKNDIVYLLVDHWKYLDWKKAEREMIGKGKVSDKRFEYLTHPFIPQRTKFTDQ